MAIIQRSSQNVLLVGGVKTTIVAALAVACFLFTQVHGLAAGSPTSIPVLLYHQFDNPASYLSISFAMFASQMDYLVSQGYSSISPQQYADWLAGTPNTVLPAKPVLITFDDNIMNAYPASQVLATRGLHAVMFVVTGFADHPNNWNMDWTTMAQMKADGWYFQFHAGAYGHVYTPNPDCPFFYGCRLGGETEAMYEQRVTSEITAGLTALSSHNLVSGDSILMAVPFDYHGQNNSDTAVQDFLNTYLESKFSAVFHQTWGYVPGQHRRFRFELQNTHNWTNFLMGLNDHRFLHPTILDSASSIVPTAPPLTTTTPSTTIPSTTTITTTTKTTTTTTTTTMRTNNTNSNSNVGGAVAMGSTTALPPIPVLSYHQLDNPDPDSYLSINTSRFVEHMDYLVAQGYNTISPQQYLDWLDGNGATLPSKPIMITFDDNVKNAYPASAILAARGFRAVMYVITGVADYPQNWNMDWALLNTMKSEGWHFQLHAGPNGHKLYGNPICPFYYPCRFTGENPSQYQSRVTTDITLGLQSLTAHGLVDGDSQTLAMPYDYYGQANPDPAVHEFLPAYLKSKFRVIFHTYWGYQPGFNRRYRHEVQTSHTMQDFIEGLDDPRNIHPSLAAGATTESPPTSESSTAKTTLIVAAVIGGIALMLLVLLIMVTRIRRREAEKRASSTGLLEDDMFGSKRQGSADPVYSVVVPPLQDSDTLYSLANSEVHYDSTSGTASIYTHYDNPPTLNASQRVRRLYNNSEGGHTPNDPDYRGAPLTLSSDATIYDNVGDGVSEFGPAVHDSPQTRHRS